MYFSQYSFESVNFGRGQKDTSYKNHFEKSGVIFFMIKLEKCTKYLVN